MIRENVIRIMEQAERLNASVRILTKNENGHAVNYTVTRADRGYAKEYFRYAASDRNLKLYSFHERTDGKIDIRAQLTFGFKMIEEIKLYAYNPKDNSFYETFFTK